MKFLSNCFKFCLLCEFFTLFYYIIGELVEVPHSHLFQLGAAGFHVGIGVVVGDMGQTDRQSVGHALMGKQPDKVVDDLCIVLTGILLINVGIDVLDVHYPLVYQGK